MGGVILGGWTHRRGDAGAARAVSADVAKGRPKIAWSFRPAHGGHVDQVRVAHDRVVVATMSPPTGESSARGWEHATIHVLDAATGRTIAERMLPDPVPVAAMLIEGDVVHVLATREGEPVFWYALGIEDARPMHRRALALDRAATWDVLDAWASADGGLWMELDEESSAGTSRRVFASVHGDRVELAGDAREGDAAIEGARGAAGSTEADGEIIARDACCVERALFAPTAGVWDAAGSSTAPSVWKLEEGSSAHAEPWARANVVGVHASAHVVASDGAVLAVAVAKEPEVSSHALVQALTIDRTSGVVRAESAIEPIEILAPAVSARLARRPNGEALFQRIGADGAPASDLVRIDPSGEIVPMRLPGKRFVLDAALGDAVLVHSETRGGGVVVSALEIDREGRLLGRRARTMWTIETSDIGGGATIYAGSGHVFARGRKGIAAIRV